MSAVYDLSTIRGIAKDLESKGVVMEDKPGASQPNGRPGWRFCCVEGDAEGSRPSSHRFLYGTRDGDSSDEADST